MARKPTTAGWRKTVAEMGPALGGIGSLLVGVAAVIALLIANPGGSGTPVNPDPTPSPPSTAAGPTGTPDGMLPTAEPSVPPSTLASAPTTPAFGDLLFINDLEQPVRGMFVGSVRGCTTQFAAGYAITSANQYRACPGMLGEAEARLRSVLDVRVQATVEFAPFTEEPNDTFGPGDAALLCRVTGQLGNGDYYVAGLGPVGYWSLGRFEGGVQDTLDEGIRPGLETAPGEARQLRLDCHGEPGGATVVRLVVDGEEVASHVDLNGLPGGEVGMTVTNFADLPMTATFSDVAVFGTD
jgi:hypothetical protein